MALSPLVAPHSKALQCCDDRLLIEVFADGNPTPVTAEFAGGDGLPAGTGGTPDTVTVEINSLLPADEVTVHLSVTSTVDEQLTPAPVFLIDTVAVVLMVDETTTTDSFTYDAAGRMLTRDVNGTVTTLTWDASSNLTSTTADGVVTVYAYDAGGQRVAQATLAAGGNPGTASAYVADMELTDPNTAVANNVTGTRFYTFGGATVAVRTAQGLSLLLGDEQGSAQIMMPLHTDSNGALLPATQADADATERTAYAPYGARRGADLEDINRGWLGQVEDSGTGLTYLNARYYDPAIGRFLSPDPLMNPGDPRTLDPYRYADNNPIMFHDATGLCSGLVGAALDMCSSGGGFGKEYAQEYNLNKARNGSGGSGSSGGSSGGGSSSGGNTGGGNSTVVSPLQPVLCSSGFVCGSSQDNFYTSWYGSGLGGLENWARGFGDSVIGTVDLAIALGCFQGSGSLLNWGKSSQCFSSNSSGGFFLPRIGMSGYKDAEASYWIGSVVNPLLLIGGGSGTVSKAPSLFSGLKFADEGIAGYSSLRFLSQGQKGEVQIHHLIEKRFVSILGGNTDNWLSVAVTRDEHQVFTNAWRTAIPYGPDGTHAATVETIEAAARQVYREYPEILKSLGL